MWTNSLLAGAFYYLYNEVAFLALGRVNPVTHAIGNTVKRVVIIIASVIAFKTPISSLGIIGSAIAISGTLLYSLAKSKFGGDVKWNFAGVFLFDKAGVPFSRSDGPPKAADIQALVEEEELF